MFESMTGHRRDPGIAANCITLWELAAWSVFEPVMVMCTPGGANLILPLDTCSRELHLEAEVGRRFEIPKKE